MKTGPQLKHIISRLYIRNGGRSGRLLRLFDELEPNYRHLITAQIPLSDTELPVIARIESETKWLLLTTKRLAWRAGDVTQILPLENLVRVVPDMEVLTPPLGKTKATSTKVVVQDTGGKRFIIDAEQGSSRFGFMRALTYITAVNRADRMGQTAQR